MQLAGMRTHRLIPYSEEFLILTCPNTRTKYAKLDAARGVVVNGLRYYHPLMRFSKEAGKPVEVRYEPFDMSRAYALFGFRNTSGQLARRGRDIHFARYHVENKEERIAFVAALKYLLERVPLEVDLNTSLSRWRWWATGCVGCIGVLKDWLVDIVAATLIQNGTSLTEVVLTRTR